VNAGPLPGCAAGDDRHGLYSGLLFSMVGLVFDRTHTREVGMMMGLAKRMPFIATVFMLAGLGSRGLPGLAGFATFIGAYSIFPLATILCVCAIAIKAGYIGGAWDQCSLGRSWTTG
jgi:NADH-quinone oxidoreductase subunit M